MISLVIFLVCVIVGMALATPVCMWLTALIMGGYDRPTRRAHIVVEHIHTVRAASAAPAQPQVIDGTVIGEWPTRAMVAASWRTGVQIGGGE